MVARQPDDIFSVVRPGSGDAGRLAMELELNRRAERFRQAYGFKHYYAGLADFVREHGQLYQGVAWPVPDKYKQHVGRESWCFRNAFEAAKANPELRYCEGVYMVGISSAAHAWCLDPEDSVIELTIPLDAIEAIGVANSRINAAGKTLDDPRLWTYYGAVLPLDKVAATYTRIGLDPDEPHSSVPTLDDAFAEDEGDEVWGIDDPAPIFKRPWRP